MLPALTARRPNPMRLVHSYIAAALGVSVALDPGCPDKSNRSEPVCARQDCATGKILDDGCAADGRCKSCINDCGMRVAPHRD